jgi:hypothetical protein
VTGGPAVGPSRRDAGRWAFAAVRIARTVLSAWWRIRRQTAERPTPPPVPALALPPPSEPVAGNLTERQRQLLMKVKADPVTLELWFKNYCKEAPTDLLRTAAHQFYRKKLKT